MRDGCPLIASRGRHRRRSIALKRVRDTSRGNEISLSHRHRTESRLNRSETRSPCCLSTRAARKNRIRCAAHALWPTNLNRPSRGSFHRRISYPRRGLGRDASSCSGHQWDGRRNWRTRSRYSSSRSSSSYARCAWSRVGWPRLYASATHDVSRVDTPNRRRRSPGWCRQTRRIRIQLQRCRPAGVGPALVTALSQCA